VALVALVVLEVPEAQVVLADPVVPAVLAVPVAAVAAAVEDYMVTHNITGGTNE
jgi:hypothetical protein